MLAQARQHLNIHIVLTTSALTDRPWPPSPPYRPLSEEESGVGMDAFLSFKTRWGGMPFDSPANVATGALFYSYEVGGVHVIALSAYEDLSATSPQTVFIKNDLAAVNRTRTPWLVCVWHPPVYNSNTQHYEQHEDFRLAYEQLFVAARVNVILNGHVHGFERTRMVNNNSLVDPATGVGIYYFTVGFGGKELYQNWCGDSLRHPWLGRYIFAMLTFPAPRPAPQVPLRSANHELFGRAQQRLLGVCGARCAECDSHDDRGLLRMYPKTNPCRPPRATRQLSLAPGWLALTGVLPRRHPRPPIPNPAGGLGRLQHGPRRELLRGPARRLLHLHKPAAREPAANADARAWRRRQRVGGLLLRRPGRPRQGAWERRGHRHRRARGRGRRGRACRRAAARRPRRSQWRGCGRLRRRARLRDGARRLRCCYYVDAISNSVWVSPILSLPALVRVETPRPSTRD